MDGALVLKSVACGLVPATAALVGSAFAAWRPPRGKARSYVQHLAALLFLVTEELLVEAHAEGETPAATALFFLGFLVFMLLGMGSS